MNSGKTAKEIAVNAARYLMKNPMGEVDVQMTEKMRCNVSMFLGVIGAYEGVSFITRGMQYGEFRILRINNAPRK